MFGTAIRRAAHEVCKRNPYLKKYGLRPEDLPTQKVLKIVREHGPLRPAECWKHAEAVGIKSMNQMKKLLLWLRGKNLIYPKAEHTSGDKNNQHDLLFFWKAYYLPEWLKGKQKIRDKRYYVNLKNKEKAVKEVAIKRRIKERKLAKAKRLKEKEEELANFKFL